MFVPILEQPPKKHIPLKSIDPHITALLKLRLNQSVRLIARTGIGLLLVCLIVVSGILLKTYYQLMEMPACATLIFVPILIGAIDLKRKDKIFLKNVFSSWRQVGFYCGIEYMLLALPLIIFQITNGDWLIGLGIIGICLSFGLLSPHIKTVGASGCKKGISIIPIGLFELKFFIEKNKLAALLILVLAFLGGVHYAFFLVGIFLFIVLMPEVFQYTEPLGMVALKQNFVFKKTTLYLKYLILFWLILSLVALLIGQCPTWLVIYGLFCLVTSIVLSIGYKYANYSGIYSYLPTSSIISLLVLLLVIPGGVLITFGFSIFYFFKAQKNMRSFYVTDQ